MAFSQIKTIPSSSECYSSDLIKVPNESLRYLIFKELLLYLPLEGKTPDTFTLTDLNPNVKLSDKDEYYRSFLKPEGWFEQELTCEALQMVNNLSFVGLANHVSRGGNLEIGLHIDTLDGLQYMPNLRQIGGHSSYRSGMTSSSSVDYRNNITNLSPIVNHPSLEKIIFPEANFENPEVFATLPHLKWLELPQNKLNNLDFLTGSSSIEALKLQENSMKHLSSVPFLPNLKELNLEYNQLAWIETDAFSSLPLLQIAFLANNQLENLAFLKGANKLEHLNIQNNRLYDLTSLPDLPSLKVLNLSNNFINDLTPLINYPSFNEETRLSLAGNCINHNYNSPANQIIHQLQERGVYVNLGDQRDDCVANANLVPALPQVPTHCESPMVSEFTLGNFIYNDFKNFKPDEEVEQKLREQLTLTCEKLEQSQIFSFVGWTYYSEIYPSHNIYSLDDFKLRVSSNDNTLSQLKQAFNLKQLGSANADNAWLKELPEVSTKHEHYITNLNNLAYLQKLEDIYLPFGNIKSLHGLQNLPNLAKVDVRGNLIRSLQPLINNSYFAVGDTLDITGNCLNPDVNSKAMQDVRKLEARGVTVIGASFYGAHCDNPDVSEVIIEKAKTRSLDKRFIPAGSEGICEKDKYAYIPSGGLRELLRLTKHSTFFDGWVTCNDIMELQPTILDLDSKQISLTSLEGLQFFKTVEVLDFTAYQRSNANCCYTAYHSYQDTSPLLELSNLKEIRSWGLQLTDFYHNAEALCNMGRVIHVLTQLGVEIVNDNNVDSSIKKYCSSGN